MKLPFPIIILIIISIVFFSMVFYHRTGYFESSIIKQKYTFHCHTKDSISSSYFYVDISGNWVLLDKGIVIKDGETGVICFKADIKK